MRTALALLLLVSGAAHARADDKDEAKKLLDDAATAYADGKYKTAAEAAEKEAAQLRNQWTTTEAALAAAKKAGAGGDFDQAVASSKEAEALAKASIFQATSEKERWKDMEIR